MSRWMICNTINQGIRNKCNCTKLEAASIEDKKKGKSFNMVWTCATKTIKFIGWEE